MDGMKGLGNSLLSAHLDADEEVNKFLILYIFTLNLFFVCLSEMLYVGLIKKKKKKKKKKVS